MSILTKAFGIIKESLESAIYIKEDNTTHFLVDMFHSHTSQTKREQILATFATPKSPLRCVLATVAFGLGIDVRDVRRVVHWGPSNDLLSYWQEVGRCARDGLPGKAHMYLYPGSVNTAYIKPCMLSLVDCNKQKRCLRKRVLEHLFVKGTNESVTPDVCIMASCCSVCDGNRVTDK